MRKIHASNTTTCPLSKPTAASAMMAISRFLTQRMMRAKSYLSAICPLVALKSKNGRMNKAPITKPANCVGNQSTES
jgi:hypothetical protein